jgi:hypothetical protein
MVERTSSIFGSIVESVPALMMAVGLSLPSIALVRVIVDPPEVKTIKNTEVVEYQKVTESSSLGVDIGDVTIEYEVIKTREHPNCLKIDVFSLIENKYVIRNGEIIRREIAKGDAIEEIKYIDKTYYFNDNGCDYVKILKLKNLTY